MEGIVGEKLISSFMEVLLEKLVSTEFIRTTNLDFPLLEKLKTILVRLDLVRDALFEADYLFDQIDLFQYHSQTATTQVLRNFSFLFNRYSGLIHSKMQKLSEKLESLSSGHQILRLIVSNSSTVLHDESCIYGRDADIEKLKHLLLSSSSDGDTKTRVISIVGMGGIGKTTLAKYLYNHPQVKRKFELKLWIDISEKFDHLSVYETILQSFTSQSINDDNLNSQILKSSKTKGNNTSDMTTIYPNLLLESLHQILSTSNFLLVLDDVWDTESDDWIYFMDIFNAVKTDSRIVITTRDERVARSMQTFPFVHHLKPLESEDWWSLFSRYAFGSCNSQLPSSYVEEIGREIAKKCDGLPLAAIELGALLYGNLSPSDWNDVLKSNIRGDWTNHEVFTAICSSYNYLSIPLQQCFAYCSIFPKKTILEKKMVVQLWIAQDLVELSTDQDQESLEEVGEEYFDVLVSRSLIQQRSLNDREENFEMHNVIHDLATWVSSPKCIRLDEHNLDESVQNLSYNRGLYDSFVKFDKLYTIKGLRSFLALPLQEQSPRCLLSNKVIHDLLPTMTKLRVLSLSSYKSITVVPKSIGDLSDLQYLNLSHTNIERLPSETCKLYNLQFLLLGGCKRLTELPEDMGKLVKLRHLDVSDTALKEMPVQIARLKNLQTLSDFVVSKHDDGLKVAELGKFPHLHGKLSISQLQNINDPFEVDRSNMKMKEQIDELALEWDYGSMFPDLEIKRVVLEHLQPTTNLKSLTIKGYGGISFPNWLGDFSFSNMVYLKISHCDECLWLPPLGQLENLKKLFIEGMQSVQAIGTEFYGSDSSSFQPFPSLEILHFEDMQEWDEWNLPGGTSTKFPSLKTLSLIKCPKLRIGNIPEKFPSLTELELRECALPMPSSNHVLRQLMFPLNSLQQLTIDGFPSLMSFPTDSLPKTLKYLTINNCENLEFLPHEYLHNYTLLEELKISYSCNSMISFTLGALPVLKSLFIEGCKNLKSILNAEDTSQKSLSVLKSLKIWDCNELESFPPEGLATPNLVYFAVWKCEKLLSLPEAMHTLTDLQEMEIDNLPNLQSFVIDDLPNALRELTVGSVGGVMWNTEQAWEHLTCLSVLRINSDGMVKTLMGPLLPASLVTLCICGLNDTSFDEKWLQHLTSLQNLEIINAPKLKSLPKKGFPSSLSVLSVTRCPLLEANLRKKQGKEWRKIARIPSIIIDDELIT